MKKLTALLLALIMVLAMNVNAFAAGPDAATGILESTTKLTTIDIDVVLKKLASVSNPALTPTFEVVPNTEVANPYKAGVAGGLTVTTNPDFAPALSGTEKTEHAVLTVDAAAHGQPGIYRYKITETIPDEKKALGFEALDQISKYIDVYVKKDADSGNLVAYAIAMSNELNTDKSLKTKDGSFEIGYTWEDNDNDGNPDTPSSYDVEIEKEVTGTAADTAEQFTFTVSLGANVDAADAVITVEKSSDVTDGASSLTIKATENATSTYTFKHGSKITLKGLPKTIAVTVAEQIAGVGTDYKTTMTPSGMTNNDSAKKTDVTANGERTVTDNVAGLGGKIHVENKRDTISPTGVVLRVAPYAIMLGAGVVLFIILKSRKNKAVEEA